ncbi:patatin-like phospholipase family protein [Prosthecobacter sp.]|uniref:patatin-like phospholipase family protein n=1 Tax=Prosthecobacter sp. TaxID=1965333 RepID=UPI003783C964
MTLEHLTQDKPRRRILALDGGGIRGVFTIEVLGRMEGMLRDHTGNKDLVLADHFDLIAGTSTGAIIATFLSWGMSVQAIRQLYSDQAQRMFTRAPWWQFHRGKFSDSNIADMLRSIFVEEDGTPALLGTSRLKTLLLIVMRNATTSSAWPLSNNPNAMYNQALNADGSPNVERNLNLPLWQLVRASTAAPVYFPPEKITLGRHTFEFLDGGITAYNNPALIAYLTATQPCYRVVWPTGLDRLHLVSIGTGQIRPRLNAFLRRILGNLSFAATVPSGLMDSISKEQDMLCRALGRTLHGAPLDTEATDIHGLDRFTYVRYNREFSVAEVLAAEKAHGGGFSLDNLRMIRFLTEEGQKFGEQVKLEHVL